MNKLTPQDFDSLLSAILKFLPDAEITEDEDGQLVVHTGLQINELDELEPFVE
jgi:hypothetical protein